MLKHLILAATATLFAANIAAADETRATGAQVQIQDFGQIKVHAYAAPENMFAMTTYIIESENELVLIDGQMFAPLANDYRVYADSLNKQINRVLLTHGHPDHYLGLVAFEDVPIYALPATVKEVAETGEATRVARREMMGDIIPDSVVVPNVEVKLGEEIIDGVTYEFSALEGGEHEPMLITRLPQFGVISVGDTAMNNIHLFLAGKPETWINALTGLDADDAYDKVLPGHGLPGDQSMYVANIKYLTKAAGMLKTSKTGPEFKEAMVAAFPELGLVGALDFFLPYLFPAK